MFDRPAKLNERTRLSCINRDLELSLGECLTAYVNANAFVDKQSPCCKCKQGFSNRQAFASGGSIKPKDVPNLDY